MAYVIAEPCIGTKDTACVDVCPVDCIHPRKDEPDFEAETQLYISPVECIDCGACVPVCPVTAIFALEDLPEKWANFTPINAEKRRPLVLRRGNYNLFSAANREICRVLFFGRVLTLPVRCREPFGLLR